MTGAPFEGRLVAPSFLMSLPDAAAENEARRTAFRAAWASAARALGPASSPRAIFETIAMPVLAALGYEPTAAVTVSGGHVAGTARSSGGSATVLVTSWGARLDSCWRAAVVEAAERGTSWCLLFNGVAIRLIDAERLYSRRFVEFDLALAVCDAVVFGVLVRLLDADVVGRAREDPMSLHATVARSDRFSAAVCRSLRDGVLSASGDVLRALTRRQGSGRSTAAPLEEAFEQSLTVVYRILFLLFAEARTLVPVWHPVYRESYSIEALREIAERSAAPAGLWDALRAISRLAHSGCRAGDLRVTPFNGRLFAASRTSLADRRDLDDRLARSAILALSTRPAADRAGRERIVYRELGVEQLGSVYETLLDYRPQRDTGPHGATVSLERTAGIRKSSGSFYTPQPVADYLVRRTLGPLVRDAAPEAILQLRVVDPAMGSGAVLVAACRYLASAYERALHRSGRYHPTDIGESDRAAIRRLVAERCLYGVDLNPMAVQLARLSLWLATLAADRPLSFLDHRLVVGDSLLGAWLRTLRQAPDRRRVRRPAVLPLFPDDAASAAVRDALPARFSLESIPSDTLEQVRQKERALAALSSARTALSRWKRVADLWCAAWFDESRSAPPAGFAAVADAALGGRSSLPRHLAEEQLARAAAAAAARRFFHWELEFPEAFFDAGGARRHAAGFDAVIGNPPWDMMRVDAPAAGAAVDRSIAATVRFARASGVYGAAVDGHLNRYQLFLERAIDLTRPGGRIGLVLPSGWAADHGSRALRRMVFSRCDVDALVGVDNHRAIFPIHRSVRFHLLTATAAAPTTQMACCFGVTSTSELEALADADDRARFLPITPALLERISGPSLAIPHVRSRRDLAICEQAAALFAPVGSERGWCVRFGRELNATDDRDAFRFDRRGLRIVDGRHISPFHVSLDGSSRSIPDAEAVRRLGSRRFDAPRLAYRDVASATNRVTLIAAILPAACVSTHTLFCLRTPLPLRDQHLLCGLFNSFVVNYLVRLRVTTHVTTAIVEQLPIPTRDAAPAACREIAACAAILSRRDRLADLARLNALVAGLYRLSAEEFRHILDSFPLVPAEQREAALAAFTDGGGTRTPRRRSPPARRGRST